MNKQNEIKHENYTITMYAVDNVAVLLRIVLIFSRVAINIKTLNTIRDKGNLTEITITTKCSKEDVENIVKKLNKLIDIVKADFKQE